MKIISFVLLSNLIFVTSPLVGMDKRPYENFFRALLHADETAADCDVQYDIAVRSGHKPESVSQQTWDSALETLRATDGTILIISGTELTDTGVYDIIKSLSASILSKISILDITHSTLTALPPLNRLTQLKEVYLDTAVTLSADLEQRTSLPVDHPEHVTIYRT